MRRAIFHVVVIQNSNMDGRSVKRGGGQTRRPPRASKVGGHPRSEITNIKML